MRARLRARDQRAHLVAALGERTRQRRPQTPRADDRDTRLAPSSRVKGQRGKGKGLLLTLPLTLSPLLFIFRLLPFAFCLHVALISAFETTSMSTGRSGSSSSHCSKRARNSSRVSSPASPFGATTFTGGGAGMRRSARSTNCTSCRVNLSGTRPCAKEVESVRARR